VPDQMQDSTTSDPCDYAIVGAGVSGLYTAWRVLDDAKRANKRPPSVRIFESSPRIGGRLLTWFPIGEDAGLRAELGGMRFLKSQTLLWDFLQEGLKVPKEEFIDFPVEGKHVRLLLRGSSISQDPDDVDYDDPTERYRLAPRFRGKPAGLIAIDIIREVLQTAPNDQVVKTVLGAPDGELWNEAAGLPANRKAWDLIKRQLMWNKRCLWDVGFWNLISDVRTPETYEYVVDGLGYFTIGNNWNAAEAMQALALDFGGEPYWTLRKGYGTIPQRIAAVLLSEFDVNIETEMRLARFATCKDATIDLALVDKSGVATTVNAKHLFLAMPRRSLELLSAPLSVFDLPGDKSLRRLVTSVTPKPALKLFLFYEERWWEKLGITVGRSVSDLPIRQTYYMPPDPHMTYEAQPEYGLIMASYDDGPAVDYWKGMIPAEDQLEQGLLEVREALAGLAERSTLTADMYDVELPPPRLHKATPDMLRHAREQLALLHRLHLKDIPEPVVGAFADWELDPFGGGWNFWAPQVDVEAVMKAIKRPLGEGTRVYVVGDGYSGAQGWIEGALTATEVVLQEYLDSVLAPPPWLTKGAYLGW
jgi:monoamine oxidase